MPKNGAARPRESTTDVSLAKTRMRERTKRIVGIFSAAAAAAGLAFGAYKGTASRSSSDGPVNETTKTIVVPTTVTPSASVPLKPAIEKPSSGSIVNVCTEVSGSVKDPTTGQAIVVAYKDSTDLRTYFTGAELSPDGTWNAPIDLGDRKAPRATARHTYRIAAVAMDKALADYLASTNDKGDAFWSALALPPGAEEGSAIQVTRSERVGC